jgi:kinetochore protein Mis12/MTW1
LEELKTSEIGNGCVQLESLLNATVDRDFDKFEIYTLRNILALGHGDEAKDLANWVQLGHYRHLDVATGDTPTPEEVQLQRRKLVETQKLNAMLKAEEARNAAVLDHLNQLLGQQHGDEQSESPFAFLTSSLHASSTGSSQPLAQDVRYATSQLPTLRELLAQLKESLHALPNARHTPQDRHSRDAKRRQYLDTQSQRALQRKGVEPDSTRQAAAGRKVGRDEIEGLEAVVQAFGGAQSRQSEWTDEQMEE